MFNSGSHRRTALERSRRRSPVGAALHYLRALGWLMVGLWGCQFPAGFPSFFHNNNEQAQSVALPTTQPTPAPASAPTESAQSGGDSVVSQRAANAATKARIAAEKAEVASKAAVLASNEAAQAAADAAVAAGLSAGGSNSGHRKKVSKRRSRSVAMTDDHSRPPTPVVVSTSIKAATDSESATSTTSPASPVTTPATPAPSSTPPPDLVSAAGVDEGQTTQAEAEKLINKAASSLKRVARGQLNAQDAERYDEATKLLKSAHDSFTQADYVAAHSLARKAAILIRLLPIASAG